MDIEAKEIVRYRKGWQGKEPFVPLAQENTAVLPKNLASPKQKALKRTLPATKYPHPAPPSSVFGELNSPLEAGSAEPYPSAQVSTAVARHQTAGNPAIRLGLPANPELKLNAPSAHYLAPHWAYPCPAHASMIVTDKGY